MARRWGAGILGVIAAILLPVALAVSWATGVGLNTSAFMSKVQPLVSSPELNAAVTDRVVAEVQGQLGLPAVAQRAIEQPLRNLVEGAVANDTTQRALTLALTKTHEGIVRALDSDVLPPTDDQGRIVLNLSVPLPGVTALVEKVGITGVEVRTPTVQVPLIPEDQLVSARRAFSITSWLGTWGPWIVLALAVGSFALAHRRTRALVLLGVGGALGAGLLWLATVIGGNIVESQTADKVGAPVVDAGYAVIEEGLRQQALGAAIVAVAALVVGIVLSRLTGGGESPPAVEVATVTS